MKLNKRFSKVNESVKKALKGVPEWEVAERLHISSSTFTRLLRYHLTEEQKQAIESVASAIKGDEENE